MNEDDSNRDKGRQLNKKIRSRRQGVFFILTGLVIILEGLSYLNSTIARLLFLAFGLIFIFVIPSEKDSRKQQQASLTREIFRFLGHFARPLIMVFIMLLVWIWLEQITGLHPPFLVGITLILIGFVQLGWSYVASQ